MDETCSKLVTDSQMARMLRVNVRWLRSEADAGRVPHVKAERRYLFNPAAVRASLSERAGASIKPLSLVSERRAADFLDAPSGLLRRLVDNDLIPHYRLDTDEIRFDLDELREWLLERHQDAERSP